MTLAIRPEHLALEIPARSGNGVARRAAGGSAPSAQALVSLGEATVTETVFQGSFRRVLAASSRDPAIRFVAKLPAQASFRAGDEVAASCAADDIILLAR